MKFTEPQSRSPLSALPATHLKKLSFSVLIVSQSRYPFYNLYNRKRFSRFVTVLVNREKVDSLLSIGVDTVHHWELSKRLEVFGESRA